jgi:hypothetical protein
MAFVPSVQDYMSASEIAYVDDPEHAVPRFLPGYKYVGKLDYNGIRIVILKTPGEPENFFFLFRGTEISFVAIKTGIAEENFITDYKFFEDKQVIDLRFVIQVINSYVTSASTRIFVTGHSLGGGLANLIAGERANVSGATFAAPGYKGYGQRSAGNIVNYYNVNDTVPTVKLGDHCGKCVALDQYHSWRMVESRLGLKDGIYTGFNSYADYYRYPNPSDALTFDQKRTVNTLSGSIMFLAARLMFHAASNYAMLLTLNSIDSHCKKAFTIDDFALKVRHLMNDATLAGEAAGTFARSIFLVNPYDVMHVYIKLYRNRDRYVAKLSTYLGAMEIDTGAYPMVY